MAVYRSEFVTDIAKPFAVRPIAHQMAAGDADAYEFTVLVADSRAPETGLMAGSVSGAVVRPDGGTVVITGEKGTDVRTVQLPEGECNATPCTITIPQAALAYPGRVVIVIRLLSGEVETTVLAASATVARTLTGTVIDPGEAVPDITTLLAQIQACKDATEAAEAVAETTLGNFAPEFDAAEAHAAGSFVTYAEDGKLYLLPEGHTAGTSWANTTHTETDFGDQVSDLKSAIVLQQAEQPTNPNNRIWFPDATPEGVQVPTWAEHQELKSAFNKEQVQTWNLYDGSWGLSNKNPVTGTTASYLVCTPAIPVTAGKFYSIGITDNQLQDKVAVLSMRFYTSDGAAVGNAITLYRLGGYVRFLEAPATSAKAVVFFNTNNGAVSLTPEEVYAAGFEVIFAERLVNFHNRDNNGAYMLDDGDWIPSKIVDNEKIRHTVTKIITVGASSSMYTSLRAAFDDIEAYGGGSDYIRFEVRIKEGTYDISSYFTSAEKAVSGFKGLTVPDWVTLKGIGNREKTILKYELEADNTIVSVLNLQNTCNIENLTIQGVHTRYAVHDDFANTDGVPYTRYCKNVHFKGTNMALGAVYGAGIKSNAEWTFEDCIFDSLTTSSYQNCFSVHGSAIAQTASNYVHFVNCRFNGNGALNNAVILSTLKNMAGVYQNYCDFAGCYANGRLILREENSSSYGSGIAWFASGYNTTFTGINISNTDEVDYSGNVNIIGVLPPPPDGEQETYIQKCSVSSYTDSGKTRWKKIYSWDSMNLETQSFIGKTVTVGSGGDYSDLRACFENISPSANKPYTVVLLAGTHDIRGLYTSEERGAEDFKGLFVPNFVTLVGQSGKDKTIVAWDGSSDIQSSSISVLNLRSYAGLCGLTVIGKNIRYVIHDDWETSGVENVRVVTDCDFIGDTLSYNAVYGSGTGHNGAKWTFRNCTFSGNNLIAFMNHNSTNVAKTGRITFVNCRFKGAPNMTVHFASYNSGVTADNEIAMYGCKVSTPTGTVSKIYLNESGGSGIHYKLTGYATQYSEVNIVNTDDHDYSGNIDFI